MVVPSGCRRPVNWVQKLVSVVQPCSLVLFLYLRPRHLILPQIQHMDPKVVIPITMAMLFIVLPLIFAVWLIISQARNRKVTQRILSDPDLLRLIHNEPDQLVSPHILRDKTGMTLNQSRHRLSGLYMYGLLNKSVSNGTRAYYSLKEPLEETPDLNLSPDPSLTVEDLLKNFEHYNYRVSAQDLLLATGLPLGVIKREMKHFKKQGIIQHMRGMAPQGFVSNRFFILQEPYRSNPEQFRARASTLDLELKEILLNENLIV
ncbi:MAG: hypothetical protein ACI81P_000904 [Neolewinella sp.]